MNLLSATTVPCFDEGEINRRIKIKRKERRCRTVPPTTALIDSCRFEHDVPCKEYHQNHQDSRGPIIDVGISISKRVTKRRTNTSKLKRDDKSTRFMNISSAETPLINAAFQSSQPQVRSIPRRILSTSASADRPSKQKRVQTNQGHEELSYVSKRCGNSINVRLEHDEDKQLHSSTGIDCVVNHGRMTIPSRDCKHRNLSAGVNTKTRMRALASKEIMNRPPSRQRHAFPTHLIDTNAFDAPETTERSRRSSGSCSRGLSRGSSKDPFSIFETIDRPPSRYMVKAKRSNPQTQTQECDGVSRRGLVDKIALFSTNQAHHDPKLDGFADVDESVPPPFRIEVTTDTSDTAREISTDRESHEGNARKFRHESYSSKEQHRLVFMAGNCSNGDLESNQTLSDNQEIAQNQLQWFGKDDQINNAHLFETVISLPSPRLFNEVNADVTVEDDLEDSDGPQSQSRTLSPLQENQNALQEECEKRFVSRRAAAASKRITPPTQISRIDDPDLQWIRSSSNPMFIESTRTVDYDSMDPETAIEQTPFYSSEDLMTFAATEMSDLHLDDYSAQSDVTMPSHLPLTSSRSPLLRTSLGMDFLSLFAQH
ncbi:hypothetical protein Plhal304r1_c008g0031061 [Plasmopara halstedii]